LFLNVSEEAIDQPAVVGIGAGGHTKVILDILLACGKYRIYGLVDKDPEKKGQSLMGVPIIGGENELERLYQKDVHAAFIGIATLSDTRGNKRVYEWVEALGFNLINVIHASAIIAESVKMGRGNRIFAGTIINPDTVIGNNIVINTGAIIDHECRIEDHAQVAPGARLAGNVFLGEGSIVGLGANVIQGVRIGRYSMIGAGAIVLRDVPDHSTVVGIVH